MCCVNKSQGYKMMSRRLLQGKAVAWVAHQMVTVTTTMMAIMALPTLSPASKPKVWPGLVLVVLLVVLLAQLLEVLLLLVAGLLQD